MVNPMSTEFLVHTVTLWTPTGIDKAGDKIFAPPRQIKCRWEERNIAYVDKSGEERTATGFTTVAEDIPLQSFMAFGIHTELDPTTVGEVVQVQGFHKIYTPDGLHVHRTCYHSFRRYL